MQPITISEEEQKPCTMPMWCVEYAGADTFGRQVMNAITPFQACEILCSARKEGLIMGTSAHDDDLVVWNPNDPTDDLDPDSKTSKDLCQLKAMMDEADLQYVMMTCNLHADSVFRNGGLANPDAEIRLLAAQKVMRAIRIGNFLGAKYMTYWVARDGFDSPFAVLWEKVYDYIRQGLNTACRYAKEQNGSIQQGTIEPKPNEPRHEMFLATTGHALGMIATLDDPKWWGVNPEILQHEGMTNLSAINAVCMAASAGKLPFIHLGNQKAGQYDNDDPTMTGMDGLKEIIACFYALKKMGWKGHVEFDNHMLRTDAVPGDAINERLDFIRLNVENLRMIEKKAKQLFENESLSSRQASLCDWDRQLSDEISVAAPSDLLAMNADYAAANTRSLEIARLDRVANRIILGA